MSSSLEYPSISSHFRFTSINRPVVMSEMTVGAGFDPKALENH